MRPASLLTRATKPTSKSKRESCACSTQHDLRISEPCVSDSRLKGGPQKLKSPRQTEANLFDSPPMDLRDYLTKKRSANRITLSCCCERLITSMLSECRCSSHASKQSVFRQSTSTSRSAKKCCFHRREAFSDTEYPEVTAHMASRSREKQPMSLTRNQKECTGILALGLVRLPRSTTMPYLRALK